MMRSALGATRGQNVLYRLEKVGAREKVDQRVCMSFLRAKIKCASSCVGVLRCVPRFFFWCVVCDAVSAEHPDTLWRSFQNVCVCGREEGGDGGKEKLHTEAFKITGNHGDVQSTPFRVRAPPNGANSFFPRVQSLDSESESGAALHKTGCSYLHLKSRDHSSVRLTSAHSNG